jgi:hypothetical protein
MYKQINSQLQDTKEKISTRDKLNLQIRNIEQKLFEEMQAQSLMQSVVEKEISDVNNLEKLSVKSIVHSIAGNKKEKLARERLEANDARVKYEQCCSKVSQLENQLQALKKKIESLKI